MALTNSDHPPRAFAFRIPARLQAWVASEHGATQRMAGTAFVEFVRAKVTEISAGPERQTVKLSNGEEFSARLVVLATGLNMGLRQKLGIDRKVLSPNHSISIGFDVQPTDGRTFPFSSLTYFTERPADQMAYISVFPMGGGTMRANMFAYRDLHDPWLKQFRDAPQDTLYAMWPSLRKLMGEFTVPSFVQIRPVDLYVTQGYRQSGVVLVGDAFSSSCPGAGTARAKRSSMWSGCATSTSRHGSRPRAWARQKSRPSMTTRSSWPAMPFPSKRRLGFGLIRSNPAPSWIALRWAKFFAHWGRGTLRRFAAVPAGSNSGDEAHDETPAWARRTPRTNSAAAAALFLNAEPDHRPVADAVGAVRIAGQIPSRRA